MTEEEKFTIGFISSLVHIWDRYEIPSRGTFDKKQITISCPQTALVHHGLISSPNSYIDPYFACPGCGMAVLYWSRQSDIDLILGLDKS